MDKHTLNAKVREISGRKVKKLRREGIVPANIYGTGFKSLSVQVDKKEFLKLFEEAGETSVVDLKTEKETYPVLIHNLQTDPVSSEPVHIEFLKIDLKKKVTANIPLEIVGESPAVKQGLGTLVSYVDEVEVEALPGDLVEKIDVDVSGLLEAEQSLAIKDLKYDKDKLAISNDPEAIVVKIEVQKEEPVEVAPVEPVEGEAVEGEGAPVEGEKSEGGSETTNKEETSKEEKPQG